ncbi:nuclease-related domain-containing protein [Lysinibacillus telephonicus]|uniref:nuclease-related domain-containing protein n=1 Tax=Lysinibacillus telephonicus TaxID=1714840 RepID=UPI003979B1B5
MISGLLKRAEIGYKGELRVDAYWHEIDLPENTFLFHNYETLGHQIDTLLACEYFILIIEIKMFQVLFGMKKTSISLYVRKKLEKLKASKVRLSK